MKIKNYIAAIAVGTLALSATSSHALQFTVSEGTQPFNVGTITLTQVNATTVNVLVDLLSGYGFVNTGGPHTPFTFTLAGSESGVSATFLQPSGGTYGSQPYTFSLNLLGGDNTPFGTFGVAMDSTGPNGAPGAYFGDLEFNLARTGGLLVSDFSTNSLGYYFGADLISPTGATGAQGWKTPGTSTNDIPGVPDGGTTVLLLGTALSGVGLMTRRFKK